MGNYITTYTRKHFDPINPDAELICIEDIAHALPMICRGNGHVSSFWSVGEHCILCAKEAAAKGYSNRLVLAALLHDASEAYLSDITRPLKKHLEVYLQAESKLQNMVYGMFLGELPNEQEREQIDSVDNVMLYHEFLHYTSEELSNYKGEILSTPNFKFVEFKIIEQEYKDLFYSLIKH